MKLKHEEAGSEVLSKCSVISIHVWDRPSAPSRSAEGGNGGESTRHSRDPKRTLRSTSSRRCSSRASQRTSLHLHFCCSRNVAHQEQAIDKAMTFQEELAQTGEKSDPQVLPRKPRHQ